MAVTSMFPLRSIVFAFATLLVPISASAQIDDVILLDDGQSHE